MSLPPRSAKQLAVYQLHSGKERILPNDWAKPKSKHGKSVKRHVVSISDTNTPHNPELDKSPGILRLEVSIDTKNDKMMESEGVAKKIGHELAERNEQSSNVELVIQKKDNKGISNKNRGSVNSNRDEPPSSEELRSQGASTGKVKDSRKPSDKKAVRISSAFDYSMRANCESIKLAKMIQQERQRAFNYTKQNLFPPGRPSRKPSADDVSVCSCYIIDGLEACGDHNCMNRLVCIECDPRFCPCGSACKNQRFQNSEYAKVMPFRTENKGWGLKALEPLRAQQFVFEYCGEVINNEVCRQRLEANPEEDNFYYITLDRSECIDASINGNLARFMNHSCEPNCQTQKWMVNGEWRIGLFAKCDVPAGTELTFDYNFERFGSKKQKCYCGVPTCRGYLGAKPKHLEAELKKKNGKRKSAASVGRVKRTKSSTGDLTLLEQNWGLPPPPKKARVNFTVDHMHHVTTLLSPQDSEPFFPRQVVVSRLFLRRNVTLIRRVHSQYFKSCVAQAMAGKPKKSKPPIKFHNTKHPASADTIPHALCAVASNDATELPHIDHLPVKKETHMPISARRRKRKVHIRRSPKIVDVLKKLGKIGDTPGTIFLDPPGQCADSLNT